MKNRTIIGIICMVLAVAITFVIAPVVNNLTSDNTSVVRLAKDVKQGSPITEADVEEVKVKTDTMPNGVIVKKNEGGFLLCWENCIMWPSSALITGRQKNSMWKSWACP